MAERAPYSEGIPGDTPWAALIFVPVPVVLVYFAIMYRFSPRAPIAEGAHPTAFPLVLFYLLFALPAAYATEAVLYLLAFRKAPRRLVPYALVATIVGAIVGTRGPKFMLGMPDASAPPGIGVTAFVAGAISGALAGLLFWFAVRKGDPLTATDQA